MKAARGQVLPGVCLSVGDHRPVFRKPMEEMSRIMSCLALQAPGGDDGARLVPRPCIRSPRKQHHRC